MPPKREMEKGTTVPFLVNFTYRMISEQTVNQIIEEWISESDLYLVSVKIAPSNRILVEIDSFDGVSIENCVELTRHIESKLDREVEDYELEVASAGLTEPFKVKKQYEKNIGNEIEVLTIDGKKQSGILKEVNDDNFVLEIEKKEKPEGSKRKITVIENLTFPYTEIKTAKYIFRFK